MLSRMKSELAGTSVLVTGATSGVGSVLITLLRERGAIPLVHGRRAAPVAEAAAGGHSFVADLASLAEVSRLADEIAATGPLDVLVNNAGVGFGADRTRRELSYDGFELRFAVNYLSPFLLTEKLVARGLPRFAVINVASAGQAPLDEDDLMSERNYDGVLAYRRAKLALISDTLERAARDPARAYVALHPGTFLDTKMVNEAGIAPRGTAEEGAQAVLSAIEHALSGESGVYFDRTQPAQAEPEAYDVRAQQRLRAHTLELLQRFAST